MLWPVLGDPAYKDSTELFKQFSDNESFKRWMTETVFRLTYQQDSAGGADPR